MGRAGGGGRLQGVGGAEVCGGHVIRRDGRPCRNEDKLVLPGLCTERHDNTLS